MLDSKGNEIMSTDDVQLTDGRVGNIAFFHDPEHNEGLYYVSVNVGEHKPVKALCETVTVVPYA